MRIGIAFTGLCALLAANTALSGPLAEEDVRRVELRGSALFEAENESHLLKVNVDYAVYRIGSYPNDGIAGQDPSNGSEYVYAYQIFNDPASNRALTTIGITLSNCSAAHHLQRDPLHALAGGFPPGLVLFYDSVNADFDPPLSSGGYSLVFLFTSPNPPIMTQASIQSGGLVDQNFLPSPQTGPSSPPDFDGNCVVDMVDYDHFQICAKGPAIAPDLACHNADLDHDNDVDQADFGLFQRCFSGSEFPMDLDCLKP